MAGKDVFDVLAMMTDEQRSQMLYCHIFLSAESAAYKCILYLYSVRSK